MWAIALESVVKLLALMAVGVFAWVVLGGGLPALPSLRELPALPDDFAAQTFLAFFALLCLPRQFQVLVVESESADDLPVARWAFAAYLVIVCVAVLPITWAGERFVAAGTSADAWVLALPLSLGREDLAMIAFLGGVSAATGMVLVASLALATMISNDLAMPWLLRGRTIPASSVGASSGCAARASWRSASPPGSTTAPSAAAARWRPTACSPSRRWRNSRQLWSGACTGVMRVGKARRRASSPASACMSTHCWGRPWRVAWTLVHAGWSTAPPAWPCCARRRCWAWPASTR